MDFQDSAEEAAFRSKARLWLEANVPAALASTDTEVNLRTRAKAWQAKKADAGWACIHWPKEYGGQGATPIQRIIFEQEEARAGAPQGMFAISHGMCAPTLMAWACPDDKARFLPPMLRGDSVWCQLFSEPAGGSDLAALRMRAVQDGEEWILNGQKIWTSGAQFSDHGIIVTRSDPTVPKHKGLTFFYVNLSTPGITIRPIKQLTGDSDFNEVFFDDVRVPDRQRLGAVGEGWRVALTTLMNERLSIGDVARPSYDELFELLVGKSVGGQPALSHDDVRQQVADWYIKSRGIRYTRFRTMTALAQGRDPGPEASIIKLVSTEMAQRIANFATDLDDMAGMVMGEGRGDMTDFQFSYLFSPCYRIAGGTDEILRNIISERVLGLPADPRVDKDVPFDQIPTGR
jgi:alkylation response protein AidB-like acyl-CoA dehydrogenase